MNYILYIYKIFIFAMSKDNKKVLLRAPVWRRAGFVKLAVGPLVLPRRYFSSSPDCQAAALIPFVHKMMAAILLNNSVNKSLEKSGFCNICNPVLSFFCMNPLFFWNEKNPKRVSAVVGYFSGEYFICTFLANASSLAANHAVRLPAGPETLLSVLKRKSTWKGVHPFHWLNPVHPSFLP